MTFDEWEVTRFMISWVYALVSMLSWV